MQLAHSTMPAYPRSNSFWQRCAPLSLFWLWSCLIGNRFGMAQEVLAPPPANHAIPLEQFAESIALEPHFRRVEVAPGGEARIQLTLRMPQAGSVLGIETECPCVRAVGPLPRQVPTGESQVSVVVLGILPGLKTVTLRTTQGTQQLVIDVVTPGFEAGAKTAQAAVADARAAHRSLVAIIHDLRGHLRNCGCSAGSLGGVDHLAALGEALPGARLVLTGDIDGSTPGLAAALAQHGWEIRPTDIPISAEPLSLLDQPGLLAVIATTQQPLAQQRIVTPLLDRGAIAHLLFVDAGGRIVEQRLLPIDRSLPARAGVSARFPATEQVRLDRSANPSTSCSACHTTAHASWLVTAHAQALSSLSASDQTSACATCHTTPLPGRTERAPHVGCTACHQGAEAHAATPSLKTAGTTNCRECHDAKHHPGFDEVSAWLRIQHTK